MRTIRKVRLSRSRRHLTSNEKDTITLSIDKNVLDALRRDAANEHISVNAHINTILSKWDKFFRYHQENQVITMTRKNFETILKLIDEKEFVEMWNDNGLNIVSTLFTERKLPMSLHNFLEYALRPFGVIGGAFSSVDVIRDEEGYAHVIITHKYGPKWSRIIAASFSHQLAIFFKCHTTAAISPGTLTIKLFDKSLIEASEHK
jgi:hypothetical protein